MERLTINYPDGTIQGTGTLDEIILRLAAYEDTGLEPKEAAKLLRETILIKQELDEYTTAKREGRLLILPCNVGDTVYRICHEYKKGNPFIRAVTFNQNNFWRIVFGGEFGKTVFLTREEAEAALRGGADG